MVELGGKAIDKILMEMGGKTIVEMLSQYHLGHTAIGRGNWTFQTESEAEDRKVEGTVTATGEMSQRRLRVLEKALLRERCSELQKALLEEQADVSPWFPQPSPTGNMAQTVAAVAADTRVALTDSCDCSGKLESLSRTREACYGCGNTSKTALSWEARTSTALMSLSSATTVEKTSGVSEGMDGLSATGKTKDEFQDPAVILKNGPTYQIVDGNLFQSCLSVGMLKLIIKACFTCTAYIYHAVS
jgi:hypothetical protein